MPTTRAENPAASTSTSHTTQYTAAGLAEKVDGELRGDGSLKITGINDLTNARPDQITFITDARYVQCWRESSAGAALVSAAVVDDVAEADSDAKRPLIVVPNAELASITVLVLFQPPEPLPNVGVHPTAWVHESATIGEGARIGPHVSIDHNAKIGDGVVLHAGVRIYPEVIIGEHSVLHSNGVVRERCRIGRQCILHQGVGIGADGFGYRPAPDGSGLLKVPQIGFVELHDDVEVGANSTIDRGKFGPTVISSNTKIDNLCQIGHNCRVGRSCVIAAGAAIGGSVTIGDGVVIGGSVAVIEQCTIGDGARIGGRTGVTRDVPAGETHLGLPNDRSDQVLKQWAAIRRLPKLLRQLKTRFDEPPST